MKEDKLKLVLVITMMGVLMLGAFLVMLPGDMDMSTSLMVMMAVALSIGAMFLMKDKMTDLKKGLPTEDEFTKKVMQKAGAWTYFFTVWLAVAIFWIDGLYFENVIGKGLTTTDIIGAIVLIPGIFFIAAALIIRKTGRV